MSKDGRLLQDEVLPHVVKIRNLARDGGSLRGIEFFNRTNAEEENATDRSQNGADQPEAEDQFVRNRR